MTMAEIILATMITISMAILTYLLFILAEYKKEIWKCIEFKDEDN